MNRFRKICNYTALLAFAAIAAHGNLARAATTEPGTPILVADYTVFVDPPSGFVFVKLPAGWKFAGKVGTTDLARLPGSVVTALLQPEAQTVADARAPAALEADRSR